MAQEHLSFANIFGKESGMLRLQLVDQCIPKRGGGAAVLTAKLAYKSEMHSYDSGVSPEIYILALLKLVMSSPFDAAPPGLY